MNQCPEKHSHSTTNPCLRWSRKRIRTAFCCVSTAKDHPLPGGECCDIHSYMYEERKIIFPQLLIELFGFNVGVEKFQPPEPKVHVRLFALRAVGFEGVDVEDRIFP